MDKDNSSSRMSFDAASPKNREAKNDGRMSVVVPAGESLFSFRRKDSIAAGGQSRSVYKRASFVGQTPSKGSRSVLGGSFFKKE